MDRYILVQFTNHPEANPAILRPTILAVFDSYDLAKEELFKPRYYNDNTLITMTTEGLYSLVNQYEHSPVRQS